ncbi:hypothetical protein ABVT39_021369 [Epinephelus coioides]
MAMVCIVSNILLLLPDLKIHFLLEGHVTREATWATGLWGSGVLVLIGARSFVQTSKTRGCCAVRRQMLSQVLYSCVCLLAAGLCCLVSTTGLIQGPLCLYNTTSGPSWGVPLKPVPDRHAGYLYNRTLWSSVCLEPLGVVQWNVVLFSMMGGVSGLQTVLCAANVLNSLLGLILGQGVCHNKVSETSLLSSWRTLSEDISGTGVRQSLCVFQVRRHDETPGRHSASSAGPSQVQVQVSDRDVQQRPERPGPPVHQPPVPLSTVPLSILHLSTLHLSIVHLSPCPPSTCPLSIVHLSPCPLSPCPFSTCPLSSCPLSPVHLSSCPPFPLSTVHLSSCSLSTCPLSDCPPVRMSTCPLSPCPPSTVHLSPCPPSTCPLSIVHLSPCLPSTCPLSTCLPVHRPPVHSPPVHSPPVHSPPVHCPLSTCLPVHCPPFPLPTVHLSSCCLSICPLSTCPPVLLFSVHLSTLHLSTVPLSILHLSTLHLSIVPCPPVHCPLSTCLPVHCPPFPLSTVHLSSCSLSTYPLSTCPLSACPPVHCPLRSGQRCSPVDGHTGSGAETCRLVLRTDETESEKFSSVFTEGLESGTTGERPKSAMTGECHDWRAPRPESTTTGKRHNRRAPRPENAITGE